MDGLYQSLIKQKVLRKSYDLNKYCNNITNIKEFDNLFIVFGDDIVVITEKYEQKLDISNVDFNMFWYNSHLVYMKNSVICLPFYRISLSVDFMIPPHEFCYYYKVEKDGVYLEENKFKSD